MVLSMTTKKALSGKPAEVFKPGVYLADGSYHSDIKIYEVAVIECISLDIADTMGVVTDRAGRIFFDDMFIMLRKTLISQNALPAVALVTYGIVKRALRGIIEGYIVSLKQKIKPGSMRALGPVGIVGIMTIYTEYNAGYIIRRQKTRHVGIYPG
jgi:hypothetical protein